MMAGCELAAGFFIGSWVLAVASADSLVFGLMLAAAGISLYLVTRAVGWIVTKLTRR